MDAVSQIDVPTTPMTMAEINELLDWGLDAKQLAERSRELQREHGLEPSNVRRDGVIKCYEVQDVLEALRHKEAGLPAIVPSTSRESPVLSRNAKYAVRTKHRPRERASRPASAEDEDDHLEG